MKEKYFNENLYYIFNEINNKIDHLFSSRIGWDNENKLINQIFKTDKKVISLKQVHGSEVKIVDEEFLSNYKEDKLIEGDGLLTNLKNIILKTYHADCTPIYFIDEGKEVVGVAHSGWKGSYLNIVKNMIDKMKEVYGSEVRDIKIYIGPSIKSCCYEVSEDLFNDFKNKFNYHKGFLEKNNKYYLDLQEINYCHALNLSIVEENIIVSDLCTSCNLDKLYSYRKENKTGGRLITAISIKG